MTDEPRCFKCCRSASDGGVEVEVDGWDVAYRCTKEFEATCVAYWAYDVRQREYAEITTEMLDRLENEADKEDYQLDMYGCREISGPELHALIRVVRKLTYLPLVHRMAILGDR